ncbi:hypothetical protein [Psychrobacter sp. B29-1]|uniref:hypothetical protein n=1 Tax=Psychrobacter sp. B29-1 TaxID=1867800 RepID=UPI0025E30ACB|nr:hypothetical protein [Psychrobacter sp. B29-1]
MTEQDIQAWEREIKHNQMMRESREGWDGKELVIKATITIPFNTYSAKDDSNDK